MPLKVIHNPFTNNFDFINPPTSGAGNVINTTGVGDDNAITRFDVDGYHIQNSKTYLQDGGGVEAQGFITRRSITDLIVIPDGMSWIAPSLELELGGSIELEPDAELIIV